MARLKDSRGRLTAYAFACGYVESQELGQAQVTLGRYESGGLYYVKSAEHYALEPYLQKTFTRLQDARAEYSRAVRIEREMT